MKRSAILLIFLLLAGCASGNSIVPGIEQPADIQLMSHNGEVHDPHMLWGEWTFYFNETHDSVDVVPKRAGRLHLNVVKFLEEYCEDCLEITNIHNNGDGTININVQIKHPFPDSPEYTGFDVKGIIMFNGSWETNWSSHTSFPFDGTAIVSYREFGDPELLNPDGYTPRWCPTWESGSGMPIFNYWPGKYTNGEPTANINGFINFYTDEERHMFRVGQAVTRTYHIALPPGPVVAGYAVDACWEPPTVTPVTDPLNDFPFSANQPEPYYFRLVLNNDEVIEDLECCGYENEAFQTHDCADIWIEWKSWYVPIEALQEYPWRFGLRWEKDDPNFGTGIIFYDTVPFCKDGTGPGDMALYPGTVIPGYQGEGKWRYAVRISYDMEVPLGVQRIGAYDIVDVEVDFP